MDEYVKEASMTIARLMCASARTAPKTTGADTIHIAILSDADRELIASKMDELAIERSKDYFRRDASNLRNSHCAILIGVENKAVGLDCGACGTTCSKQKNAWDDTLDFPGPMCVYKSIDLGIALSSAAKTASMHNADNRMMYTVGLAAKKLGIMDADVVIGLPISLSGKNIYFDRS